MYLNMYAIQVVAVRCSLWFGNTFSANWSPIAIYVFGGLVPVHLSALRWPQTALPGIRASRSRCTSHLFLHLCFTSVRREKKKTPRSLQHTFFIILLSRTTSSIHHLIQIIDKVNETKIGSACIPRISLCSRRERPVGCICKWYEGGYRHWECIKGPSEHLIWEDGVGTVSASVSLDRKTKTRVVSFSLLWIGRFRRPSGGLKKSTAAGGGLIWSIASYSSMFDVVSWDEEEWWLVLALVEEDGIVFHSSKHDEVGRIHDMLVNFYSPRNCTQ